MFKKDVDRLLSEILLSNRVKTKLDIQHECLLFKLFENTSLCYIQSESYILYVDFYKIKRRNIRMLFAVRKSDERIIPLSKNKIMSAVFPPKKLESKDDRHLRNFKSAARELISDQIKEFRNNITLPITCPISKKLLTNWTMIHIDHVIPFSLLLDNWLQTVNLTPYDIKLKGPVNNKTFSDKAISDSWQSYHLEFAVLQCLYHKSNLQKSNR